MGKSQVDRPLPNRPVCCNNLWCFFLLSFRYITETINNGNQSNKKKSSAKMELEIKKALLKVFGHENFRSDIQKNAILAISEGSFL